MPAKNEEDSIEKEVEYGERLLKTIEGMPVVPNLPRIITAATITSGEKPDGKELPKLVEKSRKTGMTVENVIADRAYSGKDNLTLANQKDENDKKNFKLISRLNPSITEEFKQLSKERYKIKAKNSELKNVLGYDVSTGNCLYATKIQGACTIFAANIKRIITILDEK